MKEPTQVINGMKVLFCGCGTPGGEYIVEIQEGKYKGHLMAVHKECIRHG